MISVLHNEIINCYKMIGFDIWVREERKKHGEDRKLNSISESNSKRKFMVAETIPALSCCGNPLVSAIIWQ